MNPLEQIVAASPEETERRLLEIEKTKLRRKRQAQKDVAAESRGSLPVIRAYDGAELGTISFPPRVPLLVRHGQTFFAKGHIGEVFSTRGFGKTWLLMSIALAVSNEKDAIGFSVPERRRVLYIDGEMARQDIRERYDRLCDRTGLALTDHLVIVAADWQPDYLPRIDTPEGQQALEPFVDQADLIIFDNRSCLFDSEGEKDPTAWQPAQDYLLSLRRRDKGILLGHHANRQGGARGLGKPEDPMDLVMKLSRPDDYTPDQGARFICDCSPPDGKLRGVYGAAAIPFGLRLTDQGWKLEPAGGSGTDLALRQRFIDYLRLAENAQNSPTSATAAIKAIGCQKDNGLKIWGEMLQNGEIVGNRKTGYKIGVLKPNPF